MLNSANCAFFLLANTVIATPLLIAAGPDGSPIDLARRASSTPSSLRPPSTDFWINKSNVTGAQVTLSIVGQQLQVTFPASPLGKTYSNVYLNIGTSKPGSGDSATSKFQQSKYCTKSGMSAVCNVPLSAISGNQCGATYYYIATQATFTDGATGWGYGPCYASQCNPWAMYWKFRFDCTATYQVKQVTTTTTIINTKTIVVTETVKGAAVQITGFRTATSTDNAGSKVLYRVQTVFPSNLAAVTKLVTSLSLVPSVATKVLPVSSLITPSLCPAQLASMTSGDGLSLVPNLLNNLLNFVTTSRVNLLTGTYGILSVRDSKGNVLQVGNVLLKLEPDGQYYVKVIADPGIQLGKIGVLSNCDASLGLPVLGALTSSKCDAAFNICLNTTGLGSLSTSTIFKLTTNACLINTVKALVQALVNKQVLPGQAC
jgi:hypothetical protein